MLLLSLALPVGAESRSLTIRGRNTREAMNAAFTQQTGVELVFLPESEDMIEEIARQYVTRDKEVDLYELATHRGLFTIKSKGYYSALNDSPALMQALSTLYPPFQKALTTKTGDLVGWLSNIQPMAYEVDTAFLAEHGLKAPETFDELLDVSHQLVKNDLLGVERSLSDMLNYCAPDFMDLFISQFLMAAQRGGRRVDFTNPEFARLAQRIKEELPLEPPASFQGDMEEGEANPVFILFSVSESIAMGFAPMPAIFPGELPLTEAYATVMIINPASEKRDLALSYLAFCADFVDMNAFFQRGDLTPVENEQTTANIARLSQEKEALEQQGSLTQEQQDRVNQLSIQLLALTEQRFSVSKAHIEQYTKYAQNLWVSEDTPITYDQTLRQLAAQYLAGAFDVQALVSACQQHIDLIYAEQGVKAE